MKLNRVCPICSSVEGEILHKQNFMLTEDHILPNEYDVVSCHKCSFVYADTTANQKTYDLYYTEFSKYEDTEVSSGGTQEWEIIRYKRLVEDIARYVGKEAYILDIGCANGGLLSYLKGEGYTNLTGLDPSESCVSYVLSQGIKAIKGDMFNNTLLSKNKKFDGVIFSHVFEHIYDLKNAIKCAEEYINENGILYIEVPNAAKYKNYYKVPYYYFDIEHINHFTEQSLNNLVLQNNFELIETMEKEIPVSLKEGYPAIYGMYKKITKISDYEINKDLLAKGSVLEYVEQSKFKFGYEELMELEKQQTPIVVWGAGQYTLRLLENSALKNCNILGFIDNDKKKQFQKFNNIQVYPPKFLIESAFEGPIIVVSALFNKEITEEIRGMGLNNLIIEIR